MKKFDEIKGLALGNFGLVTAAQVRELGATRSRGWKVSDPSGGVVVEGLACDR